MAEIELVRFSGPNIHCARCNAAAVKAVTLDGKTWWTACERHAEKLLDETKERFDA